MFEEQGLHATSAERMNSILRDGFKPAPGRRGTGVYFWRKNALAERVGQKWYDFALKNGCFGRDIDRRCSIVEASLLAEEDSVLDFHDRDVHDYVVDTVVRRGMDKRTPEVDISNLYDVLITMLEKESGTRICVICASLPIPNAGDFYPFNAIGNPIALVVRNLASIATMHGYVLEG